jgi:hypothetical protein
MGGNPCIKLKLRMALSGHLATFSTDPVESMCIAPINEVVAAFNLLQGLLMLLMFGTEILLSAQHVLFHHQFSSPKT